MLHPACGRSVTCTSVLLWPSAGPVLPGYGALVAGNPLHTPTLSIPGLPAGTYPSDSVPSAQRRKSAAPRARGQSVEVLGSLVSGYVSAHKLVVCGLRNFGVYDV